MIFRIFSLSVFILIFSKIESQTPAARPVSLSEVFFLAESNSAAIKKAGFDRQSVERKIDEGRSQGFPQISVGVNLDAYFVLPTQLIPGEYLNKPGQLLAVPFGRPWQLGANLTVTQNLFNESGRRSIPAKDATRALFDILKNKSSEEVKFGAANVFYQTLNTTQLLRSIHSNLEKLSALEKMVALQQKNDYATSTDVKRVRVAKTNLEFQKQNLLAGIEGLENTLKFLCGIPANEPFSPVLNIENPAADSAIWLAMVFDPGLLTDLHIVQKTLELNRIKTKAMWGERYPQVSAYALGQYQSQRGDANFFDGSGRWFGVAAVGVRVNVPIFDGFRLKNKTAQSDFEWMKLEEDRKQLTEAKRLEFSQAISKYRVGLNLLSMQQENVGLAKEILEKMILQHREGAVPLSEVLNAQTALSEAETNYWQQVFSLQIAKLNLAKAAGRLDLVK